MVKKTYNVVIQSFITVEGSMSARNYFYDWTQIPDVPYYLTFTFMSGLLEGTTVPPIPVSSAVPSLYVDLSQPYNKIAMNQKATQYNNRANFLGNIMLNTPTLVGFNYYYAETISNPPIYLHGRPKSNIFLVSINTTPNKSDILYPFTGRYVLTLCFEEC